MTQPLCLEVDLPPRPIGTRFPFKQSSRNPARDAEIVGYHIEHDTDSEITKIGYRIAYDFIGQRVTIDVPPTTIERALGRES
jgi:hypothetical protein